MNKKLYDLMDWAAIEEIVYAESKAPQKILGAHNVGKSTLIQAFFPDCRKVTLYVDASMADQKTQKGKTVKEEIPMEEADEKGFYAALLPGKDRRDYSFHVEYETEELTRTGKKSVRSKNYKDVYQYKDILTEQQVDSFLSGASLVAGKVLGSHIMTVKGVKGCHFAVWAPNALRVSVYGDFNNWNHEMYQMMEINQTGIFELFIPGLEEGSKYQYEILAKGYEKLCKCDPFALQTDPEDSSVSVISAPVNYKWEDADWKKAKSKDKKNMAKKPYLAARLNLQNYMAEISDLKSFSGKVSEMLADAKEMGYTHFELLPLDCQNQITDLRYFVNECHKASIGVILNYNFSRFDGGKCGMGYFDGTALFEYEDNRMGRDPQTGLHIFDLSKPEVRSFLLSSTYNMLEEYHLDGLKFCNMSGSLYLDYYRNAGEWLPNIYGGNENLDFISFVKEWNQMIHTNFPYAFTIAEARSPWPNLTMRNGASSAENAENESLGFDFASDLGTSDDIREYITTDPFERKNIHDKLSAGSYYQSNEDFILPIFADAYPNENLISCMPGNDVDQKNNLKLLFAYLMLRVGKKQVPYGQEEFIKEFAKDLNKFYFDNPCLWEDENSFEWINQMSANENVISFARKDSIQSSASKEYFIVFNFANVLYPKYRIGSASQGKYREIFNSDAEKYGGTDELNRREIATREVSYDGRDYSFVMKLAPLSVSILEFTPYTEAQLKDMEKAKIEKEKAHQKKEKEKENQAVLRAKQREKFAKEKAKIRENMRKEMERQIEEARKAIFK